ncbi:VapE domain-containing protein [Bradyrhizobium sp. STM 3562]|uniref:VapE domain-containing protein n=1 Tax=Bradyrhizobium sp. STM 3562 TaxID=578924 RepID=UPI00388D97CC
MHDRTKPLLERAIEFLMHLRPAGPWQLTAINPRVNNDIITRTIRSPEAARRFISEHDGKRNLHFSVNPVRVENRKASKPDVAAIEFVLADLDPRDEEPSDAAKDRYLTSLKAFQPAPTFVIDSGNGVQALWRLDQPIPLPKPVKAVDPKGAPIWGLAPEAQIIVDDVEARAKAVMEKLGSVAGTQNIDRIMRLPWTKNLPNPVKLKKGRKPCQSSLLSSDGSVCKLEDFPVPSKERNTNSSNGGNASANNTRTGKASIDWAVVEQHRGWLKGAADLPSDFSGKGRAIIAHSGNLKDLNFDLQHAKVLAKPYQSWSEVAFALAAIFKHDGRYSNEQIAAALLADLQCNQHIGHQADKHRAIERLILRSHEPPAGKVRTAGALNWREQKKDGSPTPSMHNARLAITALGIECSYDTFHNKLLFGFKDDNVRHAIEHIFGEVTDNGIIALRQVMSDTFGFDLTDKHTRDAVISLALEHCFDPVVDMLAKAEANWDGINRLDRVAADYLNCEDTPLNAAFMRKTMIAAAARARIPGIKFDTIPVLESEEGFNKSTALRVLAGDENFSDESIIGKNSREVQEQLAEIWIHENADLAGMKKAEVETVKAYASRMVDIARPAYGHFVKKQKRHSIEVGTTNSDRYLQSQTGNRRFWPLRVLKAIDIAKLKRDRLQLWGEAAHYQSQGESLVLDEALWGAAAAEQEARRVTDPWEDILRNMPDLTTYGYWKDGVRHEGTRTIIYDERDEEKVIASHVLEYVLGIQPGSQTTQHTMRFATVMKKLGWERAKNGYVSIPGIGREKGYFRKRSTES